MSASVLLPPLPFPAHIFIAPSRSLRLPICLAFPSTLFVLLLSLLVLSCYIPFCSSSSSSSSLIFFLSPASSYDIAIYGFNVLTNVIIGISFLSIGKVGSVRQHWQAYVIQLIHFQRNDNWCNIERSATFLTPQPFPPAPEPGVSEGGYWGRAGHSHHVYFWRT